MLLQYRDLGVTTAWKEDPPGSAGVPPAQIFPQPPPSPPPGSTGNGAKALLRPGPFSSRRQSGWLPHRRETERQLKEEDAGGTPALPGGVVPMVRWGYPARDFSESRPAPFRKLLFAGVPCPLTHDGADPSRVKQGKFIAYLEQGPFPAKSIFYLLNMDTQDKPTTPA